MRNRGKMPVNLAGFFVLLSLTVGISHAATFVVKQTPDTDDGVCDADCSLREAVAQVSLALPGAPADRIEFSALFDIPQNNSFFSVRSGFRRIFRGQATMTGTANSTLRFTGRQTVTGTTMGTVVFRVWEGDAVPVYIDNMNAVKKAVDFNVLRNMLGK